MSTTTFTCPSHLSIMLVGGKTKCCPTSGEGILRRCVDPVSAAVNLGVETRSFGGVGGLYPNSQRDGEGTCSGAKCNDKTNDTLRSVASR